MSIKIVTDSTCDLPPELIEEYSVTVVPLYINIGQESYLDGVELSRQEFYENLPGYDTPPTTAVPGPEQFRQAYEKLAAGGAKEILSIHISNSLSAVTNSAQLAAHEFEAARVTVFDSGQLSLGLGFLVQMAAHAAAEGRSVAEIISAMKEQISRSYVFAALETTEFLRRSGRISGFQNGLGTALQIKPLLKMYEGEATSEKVRTTRKALERLIALVNEVGPVEQLALVHTNAADKAQELWQKARHLFPTDDEPISVNVTPVIGAHIGPGAVGFAVLAASRG